MATDLNQLIATPELAGYERQRKLAQMLLQQGMQQPQGQMVGNIYVPTNPMQNIANLAQVYFGQKGLESVDQQELAMAKALREKKLIETNDIMQSLTGAPEKTTELAGPAYQGVAPSAVMPAVQASPQEALAKALKSETGAGNMLLPSIIEQVLPKQIPDQIKYNLAKKDGYTGTFNEFINQMSEADKARIAIDKQRLGLEGARLGLEKQKVEQELINGKPLSEFQGKATNYGVQMAGSMQEMAAVEKSGFNPVSSKNQALLAISGTGIGNMVVPAEAQRYKQAMDNFTENFIRFKSGANVPMHEIEKDLKNMMPQPGDKQDKIEQKQRARERALEGMSISAGPGIKYINQAYQSQAPGMLNKPQAIQPSAPTSAPTPGVVQDGYVFLGGDPSQPTSWRKQ
jgi:hypothetical protein